MNNVAPLNPQGYPPTEGKSSDSIERCEIRQTLREFCIMLRYVLAEGLELDLKTREVVGDVGRLQSVDNEALTKNFPQILEAHNALAKLVAPATPRSLEATEPVPGWLGSLRRPPLILAMIIVALIAAIGFIVTNVMSASPARRAPSDSNRSSIVAVAPAMLDAQAAGFMPAVDLQPLSPGATADASSWWKQLNWFCAAALGAVFYVLFSAHEYVKKRTFDPRYNSLYLIRLVLGILAGAIFANVLGAETLQGFGSSVKGLGPPVIALLGGFSTEAVYQVLQRLVEIILAAVRGDNSDAARTKASQTAQKELLSLAEDPSVSANSQLLSKIHGAVQKLAQ